VVINCVSKMYAMTGFRIGWAMGERADPGDDEHTVAGTSGRRRVVGGVGALNGVQSSIESLRLTLENNACG